MTTAPAIKLPSGNGAYIDSHLAVEPLSPGPLSDLAFSVKDIFDVQGHPTGFGNPTWKDTHPLPTKHAWAVEACLKAGAALNGKTHMDELAYSLNGRNQHYGTPINPAAHDRIPGGSSSGSAVSVAAGDVDFSLGTDTAGSVRIPASFCGIYGFRPTHGRVSKEGVCAMAASFDTVGWFASTPQVLQAVGQTLLQSSPSVPARFKRWLVAQDGFALAQPATASAVYNALSPNVQALKGILGEMRELVLLDEILPGGSTTQLLDILRVIQAHEVWTQHKEWITTYKPSFGAGINERLAAAAKVTPQEVDTARAKHAELRCRLSRLLASDGVLAVPTAPGPAPALNADEAELDVWRRNVLSLTCIATLGGLPQVHIPAGHVDGAPVGLGLIGPRGSDESLLATAVVVAAQIGASTGMPSEPTT